MIGLLCTALVLAQAASPPLSPFQRAKAESLLRNRLPCLGCHELGGEGGQIGPSLSDLRRPVEYVRAMIADPQATVPGTLMPKVPMPRTTLELITTFLVQRTATAPRARANPPASSAATNTAAPGAALYAQHCAACHGTTGRGDGDNARYLPVRPTMHADSAYMSRRPDDALFDAISGGGFIMNRSNRMPPFGATLSRAEIWDLVRYMRTLCRCAGPSWSRDGHP